MMFGKMLGAVYTPKATLFHWNFPYWQVKAVFGLESACIEMWWYPGLMSSVVKYFAPFSLDQTWSIFTV